MNRVIKFRAWRESAKRFSKTFTLQNSLLNFTDDDGLGVMKSLTDEIVVQFTGLKDIRGVEIYEGDIVNVLYNNLGNKVVLFEDGVFNITGYNIKRIRIIGNIYENPELLEDESL